MAVRFFLSPLPLFSIVFMVVCLVSPLRFASMGSGYQKAVLTALDVEGPARILSHTGAPNQTLSTDQNHITMVANRSGTSSSRYAGESGRTRRGRRRKLFARARHVLRNAQKGGDALDSANTVEERNAIQHAYVHESARQKRERNHSSEAVEERELTAEQPAPENDERASKSTEAQTLQLDASAKEPNDVDSLLPPGARTTGALPEFRGVAEVSGASRGIVRGQNVTRVSYALYKIIKLFGFLSLTDYPCGWHTEWMPGMVQRVEFDLPQFKYFGIDTNASGVGAARRALGDSGDPDFTIGDVRESIPNKTEILMHWTELDGTGSDPRSADYMTHIKRVMRTARDAEIGYIVFGQYPRLRGPSPAYRHSKWVFLGDVKEDPFLFNDFVRGVVPMESGSQPYMLYLTFYSLRSIPADALL